MLTNSYQEVGAPSRPLGAKTEAGTLGKLRPNDQTVQGALEIHSSELNELYIAVSDLEARLTSVLRVERSDVSDSAAREVPSVLVEQVEQHTNAVRTIRQRINDITRRLQL